jgi:heptosyltransferase II
LKEIKRIVVRGTNWVGDSVMTIPALRQLRMVFPLSHITLLTRSAGYELFKDSDYLNEVVVSADSAMGQVKQLYKGFDLSVIFPNSFQSALVPFLARIPLRAGYSTDYRSMLLTHGFELPDWKQTRHEVYFYLNIINRLEESLGGVLKSGMDLPDYSLNPPESTLNEARNILSSYNVDSKRPLVAICAGSTNSRAKRWPAGYFAQLANRLIKETGAQVALIGSADEELIASEVKQLMEIDPIDLTGKLKLSDSVGVLALSSLVISNDTGPAHLAGALNRPTLVVFGPTRPETTRPFSRTAEIIREPVECSPCMLRDCPIDHRCMTRILPDTVFERAVSILETGIEEQV